MLVNVNGIYYVHVYVVYVNKRIELAQRNNTIEIFMYYYYFREFNHFLKTSLQLPHTTMERGERERLVVKQERDCLLPKLFFVRLLVTV